MDTQPAQYFGLEMFRAKPLSQHLIHMRDQIPAFLGSKLEFDEQTRIELETLEIALNAYINTARRQERVQPNKPLVSLKRLMGWRHLPGNTSRVWSRA